MGSKLELWHTDEVKVDALMARLCPRPLAWTNPGDVFGQLKHLCKTRAVRLWGLGTQCNLAPLRLKGTVDMVAPFKLFNVTKRLQHWW